MDHREFDEISKNHHYSSELICFKQDFYLLYDKVIEAIPSEDNYSPEHTKFMTLLLLLRSIYNGEVSFCYNESVYNGVSFMHPDRISGNMIDFKDAYRNFTLCLSSVTSLKFNSISSIRGYSHYINIVNSHKEKLKYGHIDFFRDINSDRLEYI